MKKNSTQLEKAIFSSLTQPVLICDTDNKIFQANYAAQDFFGISSISLTKKRLDDFIAFGSPILSMAKKIAKNHAPISEYRICIDSDVKEMGAGSNARIVDVFASELLGGEGKIVLLFQERTTAEKIDRQLVSRNAVRSVSGLATMLAHEIKNPLSGIRGAAQLLEQSVPSDDIALARLIRDETDRIVGLLEKVDIFGDERVVNLEPVNIHAILERVKLLVKSAEGKHIDFLEQYDPSLPFILGNNDQLVQVFLNLIKNAIEALKDIKHPQIKLSSAFKPGIHISPAGVKERMSLPLEIIVEDNGQGVPKDMLENLFDPFVTSKPNGKGLGLPLVAKIIADHGGVIDVESRSGKTRFTILLPMASEKQLNPDNQKLNES